MTNRNGPEPITSVICCVGVGRGEALRHHERHVAVDLAERVEHEAERLLQHEREGLVVDRVERRGAASERLAQPSLRPSAASEATQSAGVHRRAVVPLEAVAQRERVGELVVADLPLVDHLRLDLMFASSANSVSQTM